MPSGKTHDKLTLYSCLPLALGGFCFGLDGILLSTLLAGHLFGGFMFGPDLDSKSLPYKRWGLLRFIWKPYQSLGGHRSFASQSHDSLFGPVLRLIYVGLIVVLIFSFFGIPPKDLGLERVFSLKEPLCWLVLGTVSASFVHHLADWVMALPGLKGRRRKLFSR